MASTTADALLFRQPDEFQPEPPASEPTSGERALPSRRGRTRSFTRTSRRSTSARTACSRG